MNTTALNAVCHRIRSVSTANSSPSTVTTVGASTTQIALLRIAVRVAGVVNIVR